MHESGTERDASRCSPVGYNDPNTVPGLFMLVQHRRRFGDGKRENNLWSGVANTLEQDGPKKGTSLKLQVAVDSLLTWMLLLWKPESKSITCASSRRNYSKSRSAFALCRAFVLGKAIDSSAPGTR